MTAADELVQRLRDAIGSAERLTEKRMFGGVCFLLGEHMLCGTGKSGFLIRVGKERHAEALNLRGASPMVQGGREMAGFIWVDPEAVDARALKKWIGLARQHIAELPEKPAKPRKGRRDGNRTPA